ncbi:MAG: hypothetical protein D6726_00540 [Nitrospirae bacterium]|nr:MAG: hypothetical protein D6726_00540 [Nitrospirota bacterium]
MKDSRQSIEAARGNFGIQVLGVRLTAAGQMIDFRYRIIDTVKAAPLMKPRNRAYLTHERTGIKMKVPSLPKVGSLRQFSSVAKKDRNYAILFSNPGQLIKRGDMVTVEIGKMRLEHLVVE